MIIKKYSLAESLNKAYLKQDIGEADFIRFKNSLNTFLQSIKHDESEEYQKNTIAEFLRNAFYKDKNLINTSDRIDLAIYNGIEKDAPVSVLVEVKRTSNKSEMFSFAKPNVKAFHEILSYYLEQSFTLHNKEIKHLIITNTEDWFIFDGAEFEKTFYKNNHVTKKFSEHRNELFGANTTQWFYNYLRDEILPEIGELGCTYFSINDFNNFENEPQKEEELIELFKILSPEHLLKKPFANDSNTLDSQFYDELLHLLGLEETKEAGKKVLLRLSPEKRNAGSLLENTIHHLKQKNALDNIDNLNDFGKDEEEQYFSIGLELCITWLNRILFLKLLESQLIKYHNNFDYKFLSSEKVLEFDDLNELFFDVLALKLQDREQGNKDKFKNIPYLNSSLFDMTLLERKTIIISNLKDKYDIPVYAKTVLKTISGEKISGWLKLHKYILDFLDAYNFSSDRKATVQPINKTIINSSVLGLIFEKLNGYKDGSYFTPSYITMYMCREGITKAVIEKFNAQYNWNCNSLDDIYNRIDTSVEKLKEYNNLINSIRLVDPAVGSGHFLVSALNEFIYIKSELGILIDSNGKRLRDLKFYIENDELIIVDNDDKIFSYLSPEIVAGAKRDELQRVQKTIFHEKQTIIENCLFGVDINPKSVAISRLRLWIELLKSAYYKLNESNHYELEVLPNIDINLKEGNSLISRYKTNADFFGSEIVINDYKIAVNNYKNAKDKKSKKKEQLIIDNCKMILKNTLLERSVLKFELDKLYIEYADRFPKVDRFLDIENVQDKKEKQILENKIEEMKQLIIQEETLRKLIFEKSFEWRFEFPEVLDNKGSFIGFDLVIGNPPYIQLQKDNGKLAKILENLDYFTYIKSGDIYSLFYERGWQILSEQGILCFITSNKWMRAGYGMRTRQFFSTKTTPLKIIDFCGLKLFDSATVDTNILLFFKSTKIENSFYGCIIGNDFNSKISLSEYFTNNKQLMPKISDDTWVISSNMEQQIKLKIEVKGTPLKNWNIKINFGIKTGFNEAFIIDGKKREELIGLDYNSSVFIKPILRGRDIKKYKADFADLWIIMIPKGFTIKSMLKINEFIVSEPTPHYGYVDYDPAWEFIKKNYPAIAKHLLPYKTQAEIRQDKGDYWWELRACAYLDDFEKEKIVYPDIMRLPKHNESFTGYPYFYLDNHKKFVEATNFFIVGDSLYYLMSVLCSKFGVYIFTNYYTGPQFDNKGFRYKKAYLENLPIPLISKEAQQPFIDLVDIILAKKEKNEDTTTEEKQIDQLVYQLYDLTEDEIKVVEGE
jgi:type II restriction/modification system DNA methylase subunit YeeA